MRKKLVKVINCILLVAVTVAAAQPAARDHITADASSISEVKNNINKITNQINQINENIENYEEKMEILEEEMDDLNAEILNTLTSIGMKEDEIVEKEAEIKNKEADIEATAVVYEEAKQKETEQYQDMVKRLRKMYESGESGYVELLMNASGLKDSLNKMDFVEKIYEFDRWKLGEYEDAKETVMDLWNQLESDKICLEDDKVHLEEDKANLEAAKANLDNLLEKKKKQSANYDAEIKKAKQEASVAKAKLQQEQKELKKLQAAAANNKGKTNGTNSNAANGTYNSDYNSTINNASGSDLGKQIAKYACQYIGNPYVSGGTSLTNGADCSGFTYRVYQDFGYSLPRTSFEQRSAGTGVEYSNAQPGDLICYSGHVAIYIGGGKIVHASSAKTGIKVSNAGYREILAVRRII